MFIPNIRSNPVRKIAPPRRRLAWRTATIPSGAQSTTKAKPIRNQIKSLALGAHL